MLLPLFDINLLLESINQKAIIIMANQRLCTKAKEAWGHHQASKQNYHWQQPSIFTLSEWSDQQWLNLQLQANSDSFLSIVSPHQQRILWERVTKNCGKMQTDQLAKQANSAFNNLSRWQLSVDQLHDYDKQTNEYISIFIEWCNKYQSILKKHQLITEEEKTHLIIQAFNEEKLPQEEQFLLVGFDDLPPLTESLINCASKKPFKKIANNREPLSLTRQAYRQYSDEITAAIRWAKEILKQNSAARIGIIVPELGQCRDEIVDSLTEEFEPQFNTIEQNQYTLPFNISAGIPLATTPLIADTLRLLKLIKQRHSLDDLLHCLSSPFWGNISNEQEQRIRLSGKLEALEQLSISTSQMRFLAEQLSKESIENSIFVYLHQLHMLEKDFSYHAKPSEWVNRFLECLQTLSWPGDRQSDSIEHQQTQLWYQVLETFASLDSVFGVLTASEAIQELSTLARHTPFQAKVPDSPIQVLGILEGAGLQFSHCWVMGLNQQKWPPAPTPNPLLPFSLQKMHNMPHASALRELDYAQSLTKQYQHCADHIVMSYAEYNDAGDIHWQASHLIQSIPKAQSNEIIDTPSNKDVLQRSHWDVVPCHQGPALVQEKNKSVPLVGGSAIFKAMVENPFDAFAQYRLSAKTMDAPVSGFSAKQKGTIMHQSLASIWQHLTSQNNLLKMVDEDLEQLVKASVTQFVVAQQKTRGLYRQKKLGELEINRQTDLILRWLTFEKKRPAFTVTGIEESLQLTIQGTVINMRIDRIDQLDDGSFLIIDYKTGNTTLSAWKADEPSDPQLPLYLLALENDISGIAFAQINVKACTMKGLHNGEHGSTELKNFQAIGDNRINLPTTWAEAKQHWQTTLETLLSRYIDGDCTITLKNNNGYYQDLLPLNRFNEAKALREFQATHHES